MKHIFDADFLGGFLGFCIRSGFSKDASIRVFQNFASTKLAEDMEDYMVWTGGIKSAFGPEEINNPDPGAGGENDIRLGPSALSSPVPINKADFERRYNMMKATSEPQLRNVPIHKRIDRVMSARPAKTRDQWLKDLNAVSTGREGQVDVGNEAWKGAWNSWWNPKADSWFHNAMKAPGEAIRRTKNTIMPGWGGEAEVEKTPADAYAAAPGGDEAIVAEKKRRAAYTTLTGLTPEEGETTLNERERLGRRSVDEYNKDIEGRESDPYWSRFRGTGLVSEHDMHGLPSIMRQ